MDYPTLLRYPSGDPIVSLAEQELPGDPEDYQIVQKGDAWAVRRVTTDELIYAGPGPVEVVRSPAPF